MPLFGKSKGPKGCDPNRVLIADDEASVRQVYQMMLSPALPNVAFDFASNGLEAVRMFRENHHGVITMDVRMPELDGLEAFRAIQKICEEEDLQMPRVVFCTGFAPSEAIHGAVGAADYHGLLLKPFSSVAFVDAVASRLKKVAPQP
jgi:CheY-like chemotaxis protein